MGAVRNELKELGLDAIVVTALDEIAWLLNLRGADVPYSPLVKSYVYLSLQQVVLFVEPLKLKVAPIREHLASDRCPRDIPSADDDLCVEYKTYIFESISMIGPSIVIGLIGITIRAWTMPGDI